MPRRKRQPNASTRVIAYTRVSTAEQAVSHLGLDAQRSAIEAEIARRGWTDVDVEWIADEGESARSLDRPGIQAALAELAADRAGVLIAAKIDRLSRSVADFCGLVAKATAQGWALVAMNSPADMTTAEGRLMATMLAGFAEFESEMISQRTRAAMAVRRAQGGQLGAPRCLDPTIAARIVAMRADGGTWSGIARLLNDEGTPSATGGAWYPSTIRKVVLSRAELADVVELSA